MLYKLIIIYHDRNKNNKINCIMLYKIVLELIKEIVNRQLKIKWDRNLRTNLSFWIIEFLFYNKLVVCLGFMTDFKLLLYYDILNGCPPLVRKYRTSFCCFEKKLAHVTPKWCSFPLVKKFLKWVSHYFFYLISNR